MVPCLSIIYLSRPIGGAKIKLRNYVSMHKSNKEFATDQPISNNTTLRLSSSILPLQKTEFGKNSIKVEFNSRIFTVAC